MGDSCLVAKFRHYGNLDSREARLLEELQEDETVYEAGTTILQEGAATEWVYVMSDGCVIASRIGLGGERQILDARFSGDFVGLPEIGLETSPSSLETLSRAVVCRFPKQHLNRIFDCSSHLTGLFFSIAMREQAMLLERFVCLGRRPAFKRLAHFIVETLQRMRVIGANDGTEIDWPFTQAVLGDLLGLSEVHVNRTLRRLREEGHITLESNRLRISDEKRLAELAEFDPAYLVVDTEWLAESAAS